MSLAARSAEVSGERSAFKSTCKVSGELYIFMMANPAKYNLTFTKLNQYATPKKDLPKKSIYVVSPTDPQAAAGRLNVIFEDEMDNIQNATGIETVKEETVEDGAIYNLQGVRVKNAQKGIFIINGKKVIR